MRVPPAPIIKYSEKKLTFFSKKGIDSPPPVI